MPNKRANIVLFIIRARKSAKKSSRRGRNFVAVYVIIYFRQAAHGTSSAISSIKSNRLLFRFVELNICINFCQDKLFRALCIFP